MKEASQGDIRTVLSRFYQVAAGLQRNQSFGFIPDSFRQLE
jgi:hypothetical protein